MWQSPLLPLQSNYQSAPLPLPICASDQFIASYLQIRSLSRSLTWNLDSVNISLFPVSLMLGFVSREFRRDPARLKQKGLPSCFRYADLQWGVVFRGLECRMPSTLSRPHWPPDRLCCGPAPTHSHPPTRFSTMRWELPHTVFGSLWRASLPPAGCGFLWSYALSEEVWISFLGMERRLL